MVEMISSRRLYMEQSHGPRHSAAAEDGARLTPRAVDAQATRAPGCIGLPRAASGRLLLVAAAIGLCACASQPGDNSSASDVETLLTLFESDLNAFDRFEDITFDALAARHGASAQPGSWVLLQPVVDRHLQTVTRGLSRHEAAVSSLFARPLMPVATTQVTLVDQRQPIVSTGGKGDIQLDVNLIEVLFASILENALFRAIVDLQALDSYEALPADDPARARIDEWIGAATEEELAAILTRQLRETPPTEWQSGLIGEFVVVGEGAPQVMPQLLALAHRLRATVAAEAAPRLGEAELQRTSLGRLCSRLIRLIAKEDSDHGMGVEEDSKSIFQRRPDSMSILLRRFSLHIEDNFDSLLSFVLAHELGHVALDHFQRVPLHPSCDDKKELEREADRFAIALSILSNERRLYRVVGSVPSGGNVIENIFWQLMAKLVEKIQFLDAAHGSQVFILVSHERLGFDRIAGGQVCDAYGAPEERNRMLLEVDGALRQAE